MIETEAERISRQWLAEVETQGSSWPRRMSFIKAADEYAHQLAKVEEKLKVFSGWNRASLILMICPMRRG